MRPGRKRKFQPAGLTFIGFAVFVVLSIFLLLNGYGVTEASISVAPSHWQSSPEQSLQDDKKEAFFSQGEAPTFVLDTAGQISNAEARDPFENEKDFGHGKKIKTEFLYNGDRTDQKLLISPEAEDNSQFKIEVGANNQFKPGRYQLTVDITNGAQSQILTQDFTWGVLALNLDQSSYKIDEMANFGIGVLDDLGKTVCDAKVWLKIIDPNQQAVELSTENKTIAISDTCANGNVTNIPDYQASFTPAHEGNYKVELKAETENGPRTLAESFDVINNPDFVIRRFDTSMRIYPPSTYTVNIEVSAYKELSGGIKEKVPASFGISNISAGGQIIDKSETTQTIAWPATLKAGENIELSYEYDAPDISPEFYLLGPVEIWQPVIELEGGEVKDATVFTEPRAWQIAADTDTTPTIAGTGADDATVGTVTWTTPEEITVTGGGDDSVYAQAALGKSAVSHYLKATNFGFAIPDGSTIQGIKVEIDRREENSAAAGGVKDSEVKIVKADATIGATNKADTTNFWPTADGIAIYGGVADLWGETWTTTDINDIDFGVVISAINTKVSGGGAAEGARADFIRITVTYGPPSITVGTTGTQTATMNIPSTNQNVGGAFTFVRSGGTANVTSITVTDTGTVTADTNITNIELVYETTASCAYNGDGVTHGAGETSFGSIAGDSFNASEKATVTGTMTVGISQICVYVIIDVASGAANSQTLEIEISNPSTEVIVSAGNVTPATAVAISGATTLNLPINVFQDHYRWRNDNGPQGDTSQTLYFNPTGNGFGTAEFSIVAAACAVGSEWDCVDDGTADTQSTAPSSDLETSELLLAAATDYYLLADNALPAGVTVTQLDITVAGADDVGNPNSSVTLGYCVNIAADAVECGVTDAMGTAQGITGADQTKTQQFTGLSINTTRMNGMQLVLTGSGNKAEISTLYVLVTYTVPAATWKAAEDIATGFTLDKNTNIRLRFQVDNTGGSANSYNYRLEWAAQSGTCDIAYTGESYAAVPDVPTTQHFDMTVSGESLFVDGDPTTAQLSNAESYTFVAGDQVESTSNQSGAVTLAQNQYTEVEYVFQANTNATADGYYCFRATNAGTALNSADVVAQVQITGTGGNTAPNSPTTLVQKKVTGGATLATGDWTNETQVEFTATASDPDNPDTLYLCVEKDVVATALSSTDGGDLCGSGVAYSGTPVTVSVTITGLTDASEFHWQAQVKDIGGLYSSFVSYDVNTENPPTNPAARDFGVDTTAPTGGTIYDGTDGTDDAYNNGSLSALSAYWTSAEPNFDTSGKPATNVYQYAIGTTVGGTETRTWTATGTSGTDSFIDATGLTLRTGQSYYFSVKATDAAGNTASAVNSNGVAVAPTLTFSYASGGAITFDELNSGNSYTDSAKTTVLQTSTNAYSGYVIKARATDELRHTGDISYYIDHFRSGGLVPNSAPETWSGTGFGYTTSDDNLSGGTADRFTNGGPKYAGWTETGPGDPVADHTAVVTGSPISAEQFTITYRVTGNATTPAGKYSTTIIYTCIPQY